MFMKLKINGNLPHVVSMKNDSVAVGKSMDWQQSSNLN